MFQNCLKAVKPRPRVKALVARGARRLRVALALAFQRTDDTAVDARVGFQYSRAVLTLVRACSILSGPTPCPFPGWLTRQGIHPCTPSGCRLITAPCITVLNAILPARHIGCRATVWASQAVGLVPGPGPVHDKVRLGRARRVILQPKRRRARCRARLVGKCLRGTRHARRLPGLDLVRSWLTRVAARRIHRGTDLARLTRKTIPGVGPLPPPRAGPALVPARRHATLQREPHLPAPPGRVQGVLVRRVVPRRRVACHHGNLGQVKGAMRVGADRCYAQVGHRADGTGFHRGVDLTGVVYHAPLLQRHGGGLVWNVNRILYGVIRRARRLVRQDHHRVPVRPVNRRRHPGRHVQRRRVDVHAVHAKLPAGRHHQLKAIRRKDRVQPRRLQQLYLLGTLAVRRRVARADFKGHTLADPHRRAHARAAGGKRLGTAGHAPGVFKVHLHVRAPKTWLAVGPGPHNALWRLAPLRQRRVCTLCHVDPPIFLFIEIPRGLKRQQSPRARPARALPLGPVLTVARAPAAHLCAVRRADVAGVTGQALGRQPLAVLVGARLAQQAHAVDALVVPPLGALAARVLVHAPHAAAAAGRVAACHALQPELAAVITGQARPPGQAVLAVLAGGAHAVPLARGCALGQGRVGVGQIVEGAVVRRTLQVACRRVSAALVVV